VPDQELFDAMVSRYPDWVSRQQFLILGITGNADDPPGHPVTPLRAGDVSQLAGPGV
jgi:hypothetical protein